MNGAAGRLLHGGLRLGEAAGLTAARFETRFSILLTHNEDLSGAQAKDIAP